MDETDQEAVARRGDGLSALLRGPWPGHPPAREPPEGSPPTVEPPDWPVPADACSAGKGVVAVHSPKGGVGVSFIASRLALVFAARGPGRTALVDLDVSGGDAGTLTGVTLERSVLELLDLGPRQAVAGVERLAARHPSGLRVLAPAPFDPAAAALDGRGVSRLVGILRAAYHTIVLDLPASVDDRTVSALWTADQVLLVTTPEATCVRRARRLVEALSANRFPLQRVAVLHNMDDPGSGVDADAVSAALALPLAGRIPFSRPAVRDAVNGDPAPPQAAEQVGEAIHRLAGRLPAAARS
jgi:Flp pilus assembly CpaE family ATPase